MDGLEFINEDEIYLVCKIKLQDDGNISVGKVIMRYARAEKDMTLMRKVHSRLIQSGKYEETGEVDKFGLNRIRYVPKLPFFKRYWVLKYIIIAVIGMVIGYLFK